MKAEEFLIKHNLDEKCITKENARLLLNKFISEMEKGLSGEESSLEMIPTYVDISQKEEKEESVIVLDAGGTNFRSCLVTFDSNGKPTINDFQKTEMIGSKKRATKEEFFSFLSDSVERFMDKANKIGFCFSYPTTITPDGDGVPISFSKEIQLDEIIGVKIGENLLSSLHSRGYDTSRVSVKIVNDTVATLLASLSELKDDESPIGFILGTGTNIAYVENNKNIKKLALSSGEMIINTESGSFDIPSYDLDSAFIETTKNKKAYKFEKKISGAYLGPFALFVLKEAIKESVFSPSGTKTIESITTFDTKDISQFLEKNNESYLYNNLNKEDRESVGDIFEGIIRRSALLTALSLCAVALKTGKKKVLINADGSTFYFVPGMKENIEKYLDKILLEHFNIGYRIIKIDSSPTIGAAEAGLRR